MIIVLIFTKSYTTAVAKWDFLFCLVSLCLHNMKDFLITVNSKYISSFQGRSYKGFLRGGEFNNLRADFFTPPP